MRSHAFFREIKGKTNSGSEQDPGEQKAEKRHAEEGA